MKHRVNGFTTEKREPGLWINALKNHLKLLVKIQFQNLHQIIIILKIIFIIIGN